MIGPSQGVEYVPLPVEVTGAVHSPDRQCERSRLDPCGAPSPETRHYPSSGDGYLMALVRRRSRHHRGPHQGTWSASARIPSSSVTQHAGIRGDAEAEVRYARSGDLNIAHAVFGRGDTDLVYVPGWVSTMDSMWGAPASAHLLERLRSFARLIMFDKRGTGQSDPVSSVPTLEQRVDDVRAVLEAVGSESAFLFGVSEGGPMSILFAALYPERVRGLILYGATSRWVEAADYPCGRSPTETAELLDEIDERWGQAALMELFMPSLVDDEAARRNWARYQRTGASPAMARAMLEANVAIDVRHVLAHIQAPTLVMHRTGDLAVPIAHGRYLAEHIPGAQMYEEPGDHVPWVGNVDAMLDAVEEFVTGAPPIAVTNRVLSTVLFTDIVASTEHATRLGDKAWAALLDRHDAVIERELARHRGRRVNPTGDGIVATFDGPARGVRCAQAIIASVGPLGVEVRAGLHTGEIQVRGDDIGGIAVHIGQRICSHAAPGEVLVSRTVTDLVAGSGLQFEDRGEQALKGMSGVWPLFAASADTES